MQISVHAEKSINVLEVPQILQWIFQRIKTNLSKINDNIMLGLGSNLL